LSLISAHGVFRRINGNYVLVEALLVRDHFLDSMHNLAHPVEYLYSVNWRLPQDIPGATREEVRGNRSCIPDL
jgi:hypothetical protein